MEFSLLNVTLERSEGSQGGGMALKNLHSCIGGIQQLKMSFQCRLESSGEEILANTLFNKLNPQRLFGALDMHGILALSGVAGPLVLVLADVIAAISQPNYNFVRDSISSLALTSMGWIQTIGFLAIGLLIEIFAAGLFLNMRRKPGFGLSITLLAFFGFGLLLIGAFRADPIGGIITVEGAIHVAASKAVLWLFFFAVLLLLPSLKGDSLWRGMFNYTVVTSLFSLALVIGYPFLPGTLSWFGLYERVLIGNAVVWVEVVAIRLLIFTVRRRREAGQTDRTLVPPAAG